MNPQLLPLGSVVILRGEVKKMMIYGRRQRQLATNEVYDYLACLFPEGYISPDYSYVFNHGDISEVVFTGYGDEDEMRYQTILQQA